MITHLIRSDNCRRCKNTQPQQQLFSRKKGFVLKHYNFDDTSFIFMNYITTINVM